MSNWRYVTLSVPVASSLERTVTDVDLRISDYGRKGWELVSIAPICGAQGKTEAFLIALKSPSSA